MSWAKKRPSNIRAPSAIRLSSCDYTAKAKSILDIIKVTASSDVLFKFFHDLESGIIRFRDGKSHWLIKDCLNWMSFNVLKAPRAQCLASFMYRHIVWVVTSVRVKAVPWIFIIIENARVQTQLVPSIMSCALASAGNIKWKNAVAYRKSQKSQVGASYKSAKKECQVRASYKSVKKECQVGVSYKSVKQECLTKVPRKSVK